MTRSVKDMYEVLLNSSSSSGNSFEKYSLTGFEDHNQVLEFARIIVKNDFSDKLLIKSLSYPLEEFPLKFKMAARYALSRIKIKEVSEKLKVEKTELNIDVVMNLLHEQNRILPHTSERDYGHENGENSMIKKLREIEWLLEDIPNINIFLNIIDGGDQFGSRKSLDLVIENENLEDDSRLKIITVDNYPEVAERHPRERKFGEWLFGAQAFMGKEDYPRLLGFSEDSDIKNLLLFADTDTTFNLAQMGVEIDMIINQNYSFVYGNRKNELSVLVKDNERNGKGIGLYRHIKRVLSGGLWTKLNLRDTQAPWKFLNLEGINELIDFAMKHQHWGGDTALLFEANAKKIKLGQSFVVAIDSKVESISSNRDFRHPAWRMLDIIKGIIDQVEEFDAIVYDDYEQEVLELVQSYVLNPYKDTDKPWEGLALIFDNFNSEEFQNRQIKVKGELEWGNHNKISTEELESIFEEIGLRKY